MRRHGWSGDIPATDDEAAERIVFAARQAIDARGSVSVSEVAESLGVTRQTVYRYFPTLEALLGAAALASVGGFLDRLAAHLGSITGPADAVVEAISYTFEQLQHDRYLRLVMEPGKASVFTAGVTSEIAITLGRSIVERLEVDWSAAGFDNDSLSDLVETMLRIVQSLVVDPGRPPRSDAELRRYLYNWIAPAVEARSQR